MFAPFRLVSALRPHASAGLLGAAMVASLMFVATPFVLPEVANRYDVSLGAAGLLSTCQVGTFAAASLLAGRRLRPTRRAVVGASLGLAVANGLTALAPSFWLFLAARAAAGVAAGLMTWVAWADAAHEPRRLADIASIGPVGAIVAAPLLGWLVESSGVPAVFLVMAGLGVAATVLPVRLDAVAAEGRRRRISPSRSNRILIVALGLVTLFGSSLWVYTAATAADRIGMGATVAAGAYSLNALAGLVATRVRAETWAGGWLLVIAAAMLVVVEVANGVAFYVALGLWGFAFWMAVPGVLRLIVARSYSPEERMGDAQAAMAAGRALGPAAGAAVLGATGLGALGGFAAAGCGVAAGLILGVEIYRRRGGDADVAPHGVAPQPATR